MLTVLKSIKISSKLLILSGIAIGGLILYGVIANNTINAIKVNGPLYKNIVLGKDLIADVLPPPEYILETYLVVQLLNDEENSSKRDGYIGKLVQLKKDFNDRHQYWIDNLPEGELKKILIEDSYQPAVRFFELVDQRFVPAVRNNDSTGKSAVLKELTTLYDQHRTAIDKVVQMSIEENTTD